MLDTCQTEAAPKRAEAQGALSGDELRFAMTFTRMVSVLMRSIHYKHYSLSDLEWLVVPPLLAGQYAMLDAKVHDRPFPIALALWASVSEEVDRRLSENSTAPAKLRPDEWRSGEILWLIDAVGNAKALPHLLTELQETTFKGRDVKVRRLGPDARVTVGILNVSRRTDETLSFRED